MFENVDGRTDGRTTDGRTTDARVIGILIAHLGAFGSGELKMGAMVHRRPVYIYFLNVPSFSSRYFNKIKRTSR